ncbi:MAG: alanine/glycine:cation symporter family protein [Myxococcota bacterium]
MNIDEAVDQAFAPLAAALSRVIFSTIPVGDAELPWIVLWLVGGASFFTVYLRGINVTGFAESLRVLTGRRDQPDSAGEVSHFQALATALSGTVGVGNIAHVAIAISVGGPGAIFWLVVAGLLGMASKFTECTLGVKYRRENPDGSLSGGPMFYLHAGLAERGWPRLGRVLAVYYAVCILVGSLGIGCMFQSNQAYVQFVNVSGGDASFFAERGWLFGLGLAFLVGLVILGGIRVIARVASAIVPFMAVVYALGALAVIAANLERVPQALVWIVQGAFAPEGVAGGALGVMVLGFRRAAFSNEAGIGSAAVAHAAARARSPVEQGFVALLEPFIDTVVICTLTGLVITLTIYEPGVGAGGLTGVELTSAAFGTVLPGAPEMLAVVVMLFAYSTMIAWSYYGLAGAIYVFGARRATRVSFNLLFCASVVLGCATRLDAVLDFSDSLVFAMALANVVGLYWLAPVVRSELLDYRRSLSEG